MSEISELNSLNERANKRIDSMESGQSFTFHQFVDALSSRDYLEYGIALKRYIDKNNPNPQRQLHIEIAHWLAKNKALLQGKEKVDSVDIFGPREKCSKFTKL